MTNDEVKVLIDKEITKTEQLIREYEELTRPVAPDVAIGRVSRMDAINNKSVTEAALRQAREKLSKLEYVQSRIGNKDFGKCVQCGTTIPLGRIMVRPESVYCVRCAQ